MAEEAFKFLRTTIYVHGKPTLTVLPERFTRWCTSCDNWTSSLLQELLTQFYATSIESELTTSITVWFGSATSNELKRLQCIFRSAEKLIGSNLPSHKDLFFSKARKRAAQKKKIIIDSPQLDLHIFKLLPSSRCFRSMRIKNQALEILLSTGNQIYDQTISPKWTQCMDRTMARQNVKVLLV